MKFTYFANIERIVERDIAGAPSKIAVTLHRRPSVSWTPSDVVESTMQCHYDAVSDTVWADERELEEPEKDAILTDLRSYREREFRGE